MGWHEGKWGGCSKACPTGTQTRKVTCVSSVVKSKAKSGGKKKKSGAKKKKKMPGGKKGKKKKYPGKKLKVLESAEEDEEIEYRAPETELERSAVVNDSKCSGTKPATSRSCATTSGCGYTKVKHTAWKCAAACGKSTKTRSFQCKRSDGTMADGKLCGGTSESAK